MCYLYVGYACITHYCMPWKLTSSEEAYRLTRLEREVGYLLTPSQLAAELYIIAI